jgi:hypothetical protein
METPGQVRLRAQAALAVGRLVGAGLWRSAAPAPRPSEAAAAAGAPPSGASGAAAGIGLLLDVGDQPHEDEGVRVACLDALHRLLDHQDDGHGDDDDDDDGYHHEQRRGGGGGINTSPPSDATKLAVEQLRSQKTLWRVERMVNITVRACSLA